MLQDEMTMFGSFLVSQVDMPTIMLRRGLIVLTFTNSPLHSRLAFLPSRFVPVAYNESHNGGHGKSVSWTRPM